MRCNCLLVIVLLLSWIAAPAQEKRPVSWERQLVEMGYLLYHLSSINVINGMNFSREQLLELREMARRVERASSRHPDYRQPLCPALTQIRAVYLELKAVLLAGQIVNAELKQKVIAARALESAVIRSGLIYDRSQRYGTCARCHQTPRQPPTAAIGSQTSLTWKGLPPGTRKEVSYGHIYQALGRPVFLEMFYCAPKLARLLNGAQQAAFDDFSCCLLPPDQLDNPVRVGQAAVAGWQAELLEKSRNISPELWPWVQKKILERLIAAAAIKSPGLTQAKIANLKRHVSAVLEKARKMDAVEFAIEKENLCRELLPSSAQASPQRHRHFKYALFLLLPGAADIYDRILSGRRPKTSGQIGTPSKCNPLRFD